MTYQTTIERFIKNSVARLQSSSQLFHRVFCALCPILCQMGFLTAVPLVATGGKIRQFATAVFSFYPTSVGALPVGVSSHSWQAAPKEQQQ